MVAGFCAARLSESQWLSSQTEAVNLQAVFAVCAGLLLVVQGAISAGWFRRGVSGTGSCVATSVFGKFLQSGSSLSVFVAGIATGFLPCGLVYAFVALAAASASIWKGPVLMATFGLGTIPVMLLTGAGLTMASLRFRQRLMKLAAACVFITGLLTAGRGIAFAVSSPNEPPAERCLFCEENEQRQE